MKNTVSRRWFLRAMSAAAVVAAMPLKVLARSTAAFKAGSTDALMKELFGDLPIETTDQITFKVPDIAENGAVVNVTVRTDIAGVQQICVVVDNNPNPLSAIFNLTESCDADISTRIKIGDTSMARALVKTADKVYMTSKEVKVTIGGCGG